MTTEQQQLTHCLAPQYGRFVTRCLSPTKQQINAQRYPKVELFADQCINFFVVLNEISVQEFMHCERKISALPYYKHTLKRDTRQCFKFMNRLISDKEQFFNNSDDYYTFIDNCNDDLSPLIEELRHVICDYLKAKGVIEYDLWTDLEVARLILKEACTAFREIATDMSTSNIDMARIFSDFNPERAYYLFGNVRKAILDRQDIVVNPNECQPILDVWKRIRDELLDRKFVRRGYDKMLADKGIQPEPSEEPTA